ncbi:unnamed protein product [Tuber melanosporum]|uniref:(Perigord truffle) hypothetical protein n=1 Tax=Tuber melanosporum (strain Mel28) TaxID=656061 RepID=D5G5P9_TUBMM|nr:uncharacterized protein GSTUM_00001427001 [Tuber melanosporum]CAZ79842.1 unnamed protein product [Tuber melanosporum]
MPLQNLHTPKPLPGNELGGVANPLRNPTNPQQNPSRKIRKYTLQKLHRERTQAHCRRHIEPKY